MKRIVLIITIFSFLLSCVPKKELKKTQKVITIWETYNNEEHQVFEKIVKKFEQLNPDITIRVQRVPWDGHVTKLLVSMISHTAPDIARVDLAWMPKLVKSKSVYDLTEFGGLELAKKLVPAAVDSCIFEERFLFKNSTSTNKRIFGIPDQITGVALFYNKDLLRKYNITKLPSTWEEFIEIGKKFSKSLSVDKKTDVYWFGMWSGLWWSLPFFNTYGVKFIDEEGKKCLLASSEEAKQALQLMKRLYDEKIEAGAWITGAVNPDIGFLNNKYATILSGPWNVKRFKEAKINFGITLIPKGPKGTSTNVGGTVMVVLRETKYPFECYKFLEFLVSDEIQKIWCEELGQIPVSLSAAEKIDYDKIENGQEIKIFTEQMKYAIGRPKVLDYRAMEEIMSTEIYAYLIGEKPLEQVLKDATEKIEKEVLRIE